MKAVADVDSDLMTKLNGWAEHLLDTGIRNNLINFKDSRTRTAEIVLPDFESVFRRAENASSFEVYDPGFLEEEDPSQDRDEDRDNDYISKSDYIKLHSGKLKKNQVLLYTPDGKPLPALKNIRKRARSSVEETGVNIAYMAFGFIGWTEAENSRYEMRAPILLLPITIENESPLKPFHIKVSDSEFIVNPTFSFKLQNDYNMKLPDFDEDEGINAYLEKISDMLSGLRWSVVRECKVGIFSFQKMNMYRDLKENAGKIIKNDNVRAILGEPREGGFGQGGEKKETRGELNNVVDADSSQEEAIECARDGGSFVLQGPPGTGKSQTITNIVAECLAAGKRVLFVSEKLAALNVVYNKLKDAGLEEFCLELHSYKTNKKVVINELCRTLKLPRKEVSARADRELKLKLQARKQLDDYAAALHKMRPVIDKTLYELYGEVSECRNAPSAGYFVFHDIEHKGGEFADDAESALQRYAGYVPSVGEDYRRNVWYGYKSTDSTMEAVYRLKNALDSFNIMCDILCGLRDEIAGKYDFAVNSVRLAENAGRFFDLVGKSGFITPVLTDRETLDGALRDARKMAEAAATTREKRAETDKSFVKDVYGLDGRGLHEILAGRYGKPLSRIFSKGYRQTIGKIRECMKTGHRLKYGFAVKSMEDLSVYQQKIREFKALDDKNRKLFGEEYKGLSTDFTKLISDLSALGEIMDGGNSFTGFLRRDAGWFAAERPSFRYYAAKYREVFAAGGDAAEHMRSCFDPSEYDLFNADLSQVAEKTGRELENIDGVRNWSEFRKALNRLDELDLRRFADSAIDNGVGSGFIVQAFRKAFYSQWIDLILSASPEITELTRVPHDQAVKFFADKDRLNFEVSKARIRSVLSARRPDLDMVSSGSDVAVLLREGEKKRKQKSVRTLLSEIGELAMTLKPCFLMSPLSVSTYLSPDMKFDIVVFDEASQIFPQDAVGAVYRGKQLIVVGDSKQMPPSNFFSASVTGSDDDDLEDITDFESILDLCATVFPQYRLKWHYRSRYEQLISFSNKNFYDNELTTFPSTENEDGKEGIGVDYYHVDGTFDRRSRTNRAEAEYIVDLVFDHFTRRPERSLGVVAFSISQQSLIERLIDKRLRDNQFLQEFFGSERPEPFFVKNLETVQGDERDTIIFSVAYGVDPQGRLLLNFGPLNRQGGERRLNVAVTRARCNVVVVSSMHCYDIDLSRTSSEGARLLREYLDFAENGTRALDRGVSVGTVDRFDSPFEADVCEFLRGKGFSVDTQVGCSSYRIDLGLKRPSSSDYVLAIECDGAGYHSSRSARDRDRLRQQVLEKMGWKFYRVWSTDWFRNNRMEKERLCEAAGKALERNPRKKPSKAPEEPPG